MQREDVDRMDWKAAWYALDADARALLDRAEKAEAERDALQGQLNDLRNGWANSVKAHAALLAERDAAYRAGYRDGFSVTGEGGNQEYPWDQFGRDPEQDEDWLWQRESLLEKYKARPE